ncbi:hypothetical protein [Selenomonas sp. KH1T6]|uniref:hypothetical protein n=1 Tax=Selenomonas sp. KH1T6 TaxID=3158784 RepID=UPI0008A7A97A|nr:hypothetical protein SAMN05216583_1462 [Selenomonas ruminantium]
MATTKKTTTTAAKNTTAAKKTVKAAETKAVKAEATTKTAAAKKTTASKKYMYVFFNCNDEKDAASMNIRYNNETFADTAAGRMALLKKVEDEAAAGRVNVFDAEAVKNDILKGEPTDASAKLQYGDIERLVVVA